MKLKLLIILFSGGALTACSEVSVKENANPALTAFVQRATVNVSVQEFEKMIKDNPGTIVDVRTPEEVKDGYIPGAININYLEDDFSEKAGELDKSRPVYVYCRSGARSSKASKILISLGFTQVYNLDGGFMEWSAQGKEISK